MVVAVIDRKHRPLMPCSEKRVRQLLERDRAVVHRLQPFVIRLKDRTVEDCQFQNLHLKLDPGSRITGMAILRKDSKPDEEITQATAIVGLELKHKTTIKANLDKRRMLRRSRRSRKTRYRKPRFLNRRQSEDWIPPSLKAKLDQTIVSVNKLCRWFSIT